MVPQITMINYISWIMIPPLSRASMLQFVKKNHHACHHRCRIVSDSLLTEHSHMSFRPVPVPKQKNPEKIILKPGESKWTCSCGLSKKFPYCDGSHSAYNKEHGTTFAPIPLKNETEEDKAFWLCMCGHSKNRPLCDGSHSSLHEVPA